MITTTSDYSGHSAGICYWANTGTGNQDYTAPEPTVVGYSQPVKTLAPRDVISTTFQQQAPTEQSPASSGASLSASTQAAF